MPSLLHRSNQPAAPIPADQAGAVRKRLLAGVLVFLAAVAIGWLAYVIVWQRPVTQRDKERTAASAGRLREAMPPPLPEAKFLPVTAQEAVDINEGIPVSRAAIEIAPPFYLPRVGVAAAGNSRALQCLTSAIYYEAGGEPTGGQLAVAQVVLNRVRHPAFPKSVCEVVFQGAERRTGCQFSFTCDGSLARRPSRTGWARALGNAGLALSGGVEPLVGMSTHFHTKWVVPYWASSLDKIGPIGAHIFYRWKGQWGRRTAFSASYAGEPLTDGGLLMPPSEQDVALETGLLPVPTQPSLIVADDTPRLPSSAPSTAAPALRADSEAGTLLIDQNPKNLPAD